MVRREEKKQTRRKDGDCDDSAKAAFNPQELRSHRYTARMFCASLRWLIYSLVCSLLWWLISYTVVLYFSSFRSVSF